MAAVNVDTEAIVLDTFDHGESDLIVTFFTQGFGRVSGIAKGAKKSKKRFVNKLELFSFLHVVYRQNPNRSLVFLTEAELYTGFMQIRNNYNLYATASLIREFLLIASKEGEPDSRIFQLSLWAIHSLNTENLPAHTVLAFFLVRFFDFVGYRPDFHKCVHCDQPVSSTYSYIFDARSGGLLCSACNSYYHKDRQVSHGTIKILSTAQIQPLNKLHRLKISGTILQETLSLLQQYGNELFQKEIVSWKSIKKPQR